MERGQTRRLDSTKGSISEVASKSYHSVTSLVDMLLEGSSFGALKAARYCTGGSIGAHVAKSIARPANFEHTDL
jgi:hypothetical protein